MTWSFNPALPSALDRVRLKIGDIDADYHEVEDETITAVLTEQAQDVLRAALVLAEALAAKYAKRVDRTVGAMSLSASDRFKHYQDLVARLRAELTAGPAYARRYGLPYAGGISVADKEVAAGDSDRPEPAFTRALQEIAP